MLNLRLPFIPPTANHCQKHRLMGRRIVRYNTPQYNAFKADVEAELNELNEATRDELVALLSKPHAVYITIDSPNVITQKASYSKTFGDIDNFIKPLLDSIYKPLGANDSYIYKIQAMKRFQSYDEGNTTTITFLKPNQEA
jgi:Holliday junction resolvase RusA-like endonuclease